MNNMLNERLAQNCICIWHYDNFVIDLTHTTPEVDG